MIIANHEQQWVSDSAYVLDKLLDNVEKSREFFSTLSVKVWMKVPLKFFVQEILNELNVYIYI